MWEAVAADVGAVLAWAAAYDADGLAGKEVYVSADDRVVVLAHWAGEPPATLDPPPPAAALRREPHAWRFTRVP